VGGKYSDQWHQSHMADPRSVVPESIMPPYKFLFQTPLDYRDIVQVLRTNRDVGVPYDSDEIANAKKDLEAQADPDNGDTKGLAKRYGKSVQARDFDGDPGHITEGDALIAYLQMLGTLIDFKSYQADAPENRR
jgi:cytochrome c oxidase cbb3-type subunit 2